MVLHEVQERDSPKVNIWCESDIDEVIRLMIDQSWSLQVSHNLNKLEI